MYIDTKASVDGFEPPIGVDELYCLYGSNLTTMETLVYAPASFFRRPFPDQVPSLLSGNGDGTVNLRSLRVCLNWPRVEHIVLPGCEHVSILSSPLFIDHVARILNAKLPANSMEP
ncbi:unnamed protein product [Protopolystoma xenopodis]|uniref:Uncharacterized protein n=1 Tax=Protopolystoma xenopodis TaxID=117903 RepID=A0A448X6W9_9PLAT|nr:unnamed protein product [Protopolystoma xenopodis]